MSETPLTLTDAARMVLECMEESAISGKELGRTAMLGYLRRVIREGVAAVRACEQTVTFEVAAWSSVAARAGRRPCTLRDLRNYVRRLLRVPHAGEQLLRRMSTRDCRRILDAAFGGCASSYKKGRMVLHSIFSHGIRQEWADSNPVDRIEVPAVQEKRIIPLSLEEVVRLERAASLPEHRVMQLSLHLMLYCGLRPTEVQRLQVEDIDLHHRLVMIRPQTSKTGGGRVVTLHRAAALRHVSFVIPRNWSNRWRALRLEAGFSGCWTSDVCRHSFASYHLAHFRNLAALQVEMGHRDSSLLRTRYTVPILGKAREYWTH